MMKLMTKIKKLVSRKPGALLPEFPPSILLEPTNACNIKCRMCPIHGEGVNKSREIGFIKKDLWTGIIEEIGSWPSHVNLDIHGAGEPLLHPEFFDMLSLAKSKENITAGFLCNATLLDQEKAKAVIETGVDWICFSVDGAQKEVFEYYRKGAQLETVERNIKYLLSLRKQGRPSIYFNMVNHDEADLDLFIDTWAGLVDSLSISIKRPVRREDQERLKLLKPCSLLYQQLVIGWPGKTGLCCEDLWGDMITGEFPAATLHDIWHASVLRKVRKLHEAGRQDKIDLCRTCNTIHFHQYEEQVEVRNATRTLVRRELPALNPELASPSCRKR